MEDGGRINAAAVGAGLAVPLLPPGSDMIDESPAPLLPLLGPMAAAAADAEAASLSGFQRALPPHHHQHQQQQQRRKKPMHWAVAGLILFGFSAPAALVTVRPTD